jgi:hypothetical protein
MLRAGLLFLSLIAVVALVAGSTMNGWHTLPAAIAPGLLLLALLFERFVYKPIRSEAPGAGWNRTDEQFIDPPSGRHVVVYYNPRTGERRYVAEPAAP